MEEPLPPVTVCSEQKVAVLSISADQTVQLHVVPPDAPATFTGGLCWLAAFALLLYLLLVAMRLTRHQEETNF